MIYGLLSELLELRHIEGRQAGVLPGFSGDLPTDSPWPAFCLAVPYYCVALGKIYVTLSILSMFRIITPTSESDCEVPTSSFTRTWTVAKLQVSNQPLSSSLPRDSLKIRSRIDTDKPFGNTSHLCHPDIGLLYPKLSHLVLRPIF